MNSFAEPSPTQQIKLLANQILYEKKTATREQRIAACEQLQNILLSLNDIKNLNLNWRDLANDMLQLLSTRVNPETKRAIAECIGAIGFLLAQQYNEFVGYIFDAVAKASDKYLEERTMILRSLASSLKFIGSRSAQDRVSSRTVKDVMAAMKEYLDTNDSPVILIPLLDICLAVAQNFPEIFKDDFDEVVDFTVGWYIEPGQPISVVNKCREVLIDLRPYWMNATSSALTLMKQFLVDANAYLKDMDEETKIEEALRKIAALYRALATMIDVATAPLSLPMAVTFLNKMLTQITEQLSALMEVCATEVNDVFSELCEVLWLILMIRPSVETLMCTADSVRTVVSHPFCTIVTITKGIEFYDKVFDRLAPELTAKIMYMVIGEAGAFRSRHGASREISRAICSFYARLLTPKALPVLQAAYSLVRTELRDLFFTLEQNSGESFNADAVFYAKRDALLLLRSLTALGEVKNSLIGMMGLTPSLFTLLVNEMPIAEEWLITQHPSCHFALIYLLKLHCEKHDNFIANSVWLTGRNRLPMLSEGPTANHSARIFQLLARLLSFDQLMWPDTRSLLMDWIHGIAFGMTADVLVEVLDRPETIQLREALLNSFLHHSLPKKSSADYQQKSVTGTDPSKQLSGARVRYFTVLRRLGVFEMVQSGGVYERAKFVHVAFKSAARCEQEKAIGIWQAIPPALFISSGITQLVQTKMEFEQPRVLDSLFTSEHFMLMVNFMLNSVVPTYCADDLDDGNWMEDVVAIIYSNSVGNVRFDLDHVSKWRWAIAQTAKFCIDNRLRTPLGKALDTFLRFESEVRQLALSLLSRRDSAVQNETSQKEERLEKEENTALTKGVLITRGRRAARDDEEEGCENREPRQLSAAEQWWRVRSFLEMIEMLDKLICFAGDGAIFPLANVSIASQQFFITNAMSCSSWLSRMYLLTMAVAYHNGNYAQVVRLGGCALRDAERRRASRDSGRSTPRNEGSCGDAANGSSLAVINPTTHTCLSWLARALIELGGSQATLGLYHWVKKIYRIEVDWIRHAAALADGRIEEALEGLIMCAVHEHLPENIFKTVRQLILFALSQLRHPSEIARAWDDLSSEETTATTGAGAPEGFEERAWMRVKALATFEPYAENENCETIPWDMNSRFESFELKLMSIARLSGKDNRSELAELTRQLGEDARLLMMADTSARLHKKASVLHLLATAIKDWKKPSHKQNSSNIFDPLLFAKENVGSTLDCLSIGRTLSAWIENCHDEGGTVCPLRIVSDEANFHMGLCKAARKAGNFRFAERELRLYASKLQLRMNGFQSKDSCAFGLNKENDTGITNGARNCISAALRDCYEFGITFAVEASKLMWASCEDHIDSGTSRIQPFLLLFSCVCNEVDRLLFRKNLVCSPPVATANALLDALIKQGRQKLEGRNDLAKAFALLATWLEEEESLYSQTLKYSACTAYEMLIAEKKCIPNSALPNPVSDLVGSLLSTSSKLAPYMYEAHARLGDWAYRCARSKYDESVGMVFTTEERKAIVWNIKDVCPSVDEKTVETVIQALANADNLISWKDDMRVAVGAFFTEEQWERLFGTESAIVGVWSNACSRMIACYDCSLRSYFTYLQECGDSVGYDQTQGAIGTVIATLRILRLLVKHYDSLETVISVELRRTDEMLWKDVLPQLFARLNHPENAVRHTLCSLLERIAIKAPHAICYPAVVGATQLIMMHSATDEEENPEEENDEIGGAFIGDGKKRKTEQDRSLMVECCQRVVALLNNHYPCLVQDVVCFVKELQRINMLNEERWLFVLTNLDQEMNRRAAQIETENARTLACSYLSDDEKNLIIVQRTSVLASMVYNILDDLFARTCLQEPTTENERQFRDSFYLPIRFALDHYEEFKMEPRKSWMQFKNVLMTLNRRANKRAMLVLQTADISPHLVNLNHSHIPLPGQESKVFSEVVTVERMAKQAIILPTKTRPKKVVFLGSDGKDHPFLFKGQEDLHLDERVMQLLHICNLMLSHKESGWPAYFAKNYSVTPLGYRSGLIQWVEGATPLFHVYRKWQNRKSALKSTSKEEQSEIERPSELFVKKLKEAFESNSIAPDVLADRQKWPVPILKTVVGGLIKETPKDLLSRELWLRSGSADTWYRVTQRFARSTAVMSMVGSMLGLGDRHLDNVLVNMASGHIVHIDYNICFDKGRILRVPETVPFRLTGNMVHALGPTHIEGTFRLSCEHVLAKLRAGKEVLLTILDAFIYDPLVDWAAAQDLLATNNVIGVAVMLAVYDTDVPPERARYLARVLFAVRAKELAVPWISNGNRLFSALSRAVKVIDKVLLARQGLFVDYGGMVKGRNCDYAKKFEAEITESIKELKQEISNHHQIMHNVRPLLRSLAHKDYTFRSYLRLYKSSFIDPLSRGQKLLDDVGNQNFSVSLSLFRSVIERIHFVYDRLLSLANTSERPRLSSEIPRMPSPELEGAATEFKQQEMQNIHAKNVSRRIRQKLEGKDPVVVFASSSLSNERIESAAAYSASKDSLSVADQVDMLIRQATSLSNLALMYEGWTAWV